VWGAWIETSSIISVSQEPSGRAPCGARGLKHQLSQHLHSLGRRAPCGARGLKLMLCVIVELDVGVAPRVGRVD